MDIAGNVSRESGAFGVGDRDESLRDARFLESVGYEFARLGAELAAGDVEVAVVNDDQYLWARWRDETKGHREDPKGCDSDCWQEPPHNQA